MTQMTHSFITRHCSRFVTVLIAVSALFLAGCGRGEQESVAEDVAQSETPELATREPEPAAQPEAAVPVMQPGEEQIEPVEPEEGIDIQDAVARLAPTEGYQATGEVTFKYVEGVMLISGTVRGVEPGPHGFHVHEVGDCSAPDASSAGGHFAPDGDPHGSPDSINEKHHVGDLGNIVANDDGVADIDISDAEMTLDAGPKSVLGRSVIVHAGEDDFVSQPSGDAGPRIACGIIHQEIYD